MKYLILFFSLLLLNTANGQADKLPVHWEFYRNPLYHDAIIKYKESVSGCNSVFNFDFPLGSPTIGIIICKMNIDSTKNITEMSVYGCFDESWRKGKYDFFGFSQGRLVLINTGSGKYPNNEEWSQIVQDRVYIRPLPEKRLEISWKSVYDKKLILIETEGSSFNTNGDISQFYKNSPYNYRVIKINHKTGYISII